MLYVMLCGYPPFLSENEDEIRHMILKGKFIFEGMYTILIIVIIIEEDW
jgi:hypothetical protein